MFANFLLDKASHPSTDSDDDSDREDGSKDKSGAFPSFEQYLRERSEIKKILSRRTLD